jgi:hypothetical protein
MSGGGRERYSCQASAPSAMLGICVWKPLLPCGWECVPFPTRRQCRKECDGVSRHEAAEISSPMLLRRWRRCRGRSSGCLDIAPCGVGAHALHTVAQSIVKTATLKGGRCSLDPSSSPAIRAPCTLLPDVHKPQYHVEADSRDLGHYDTLLYCRRRISALLARPKRLPNLPRERTIHPYDDESE